VFPFAESNRDLFSPKELFMTADSKTLQLMAGQFRDMASRETRDFRRQRYLSLATQCESLAETLEDEEKKRPRLV